MMPRYYCMLRSSGTELHPTLGANLADEVRIDLVPFQPTSDLPETLSAELLLPGETPYAGSTGTQVYSLPGVLYPRRSFEPTRQA